MYYFLEAEGTAVNGSINMISTLVLLAAMVAIFYFFMYRPQKKQEKETKSMLDSLQIGDEITTIGGMVGKIVDVSGDLITFETGEDRVRIQVTKWAISTNSVDKSGEQQK